ncbi:ABC transporter substrate-binding protein [Roseibium sp.]|uniref:ABC transporter substrate-binding protein n=1 Tax=Roseibium sp. TaxID=1936156 RepID=UPI003D0C16A2
MRFFKRMTLLGAAAATLLGGSVLTQAAEELSGDLNIFLDTSNPAPRAAMEGMIERFQKMHPDVNIKTTIIDSEGYKTQIRNFLSANPPDVVTWFAGNRMKPYVETGLFEDVSVLWQGELAEELASTRKAMTIDGKQWGIPYSFYQWGVYYREDIYKELGLTEPKNWDEFKANCQKIIDSGRKCFSIGTKFLWTAAGWFDYLDLRQNGYEFHMDLTDGKISWEDQRVRDVFALWRELIDMGAFVDNHAAYSWQEALPFMVKGEAAGYLLGNFIVPPLREAGLTDDKLGFYQFPEIVAGIPLAEDAPTNSFHVPSGAKNKENALAFLAYVADADNQSILSEQLGQLAVNSKSKVPDDKFMETGFEMLGNAYALAQFFDRDAPSEMARIGMEGFQEFMVKPDNLDRILARLERARQRIY